MIRILEHGYRFYMEAKCPVCGCRFQYDQEDIKKDSTYKFYSNYWTNYIVQYVECPECHNRINVWSYDFNSPDIEKYTWTCSCEECNHEAKDD